MLSHKIAPFSMTEIGAESIESIRSIAHTTWPISYRDMLTPEQIANMLTTIYSADNLAQEMKAGNRFWLVMEASDPVGFVSAYAENTWVWIKKLYVLPRMQGRGVGRALMENVTTHFPTASEARLLVHRENFTAQRAYERFGFHVIGEVPVQMGDFAFIDLLYSKLLRTPA